MHVIVKEPMKLAIDNMSSINYTKHPIANGRSKHIETRFHFLIDQVNKERLELVYCKIKEQVANIWIKPLKKEKFEKLRNMLAMWSLHNLS